MSISLFTLPTYKDMTHVSEYCYLQGKAVSCKDGELEAFAPIWSRLTAGKFPGSLMDLKTRILDREYSEYPIVFISSDCWPKIKGRCMDNAHTTVHVVQKQNQHLEVIKTYEHRYIDRKVGVIVCEKTTIHDGAVEPSYKYWFYEKDSRRPLPEGILDCEFSQKKSGTYLSIEKYEDMPENANAGTLNEYDSRYLRASGYLSGPAVDELMKQYTSRESCCNSCKLIDWGDSWTLVVQDEFGQYMFRTECSTVEEFFEKNNLFGMGV